jgi:hypothetical protein
MYTTESYSSPLQPILISLSHIIWDVGILQASGFGITAFNKFDNQISLLNLSSHIHNYEEYYHLRCCTIKSGIEVYRHFADRSASIFRVAE